MPALSLRRLPRFNKTRIDLLLDMTLALAFVLALEKNFTGLNLHELIGAGLAVGLLLHIALHWRWIFSITRTFFHKLLHESRFSYVLNLVLFVDMLVIIVTGIAISRTLGLNLGLERSLSGTFERVHILASSFSLLLVGLHVALHWKWIATHSRQYLLRLPFRRIAQPSQTAGAAS